MDWQSGFLNADSLEELTSRMRSEDIPKILDRLEAVFDPEMVAKRKEKKKTSPDEGPGEADRRAAGDEHGFGGRQREAAGPDGRLQPAQDHGGIHSGHKPRGSYQARAGLHRVQLGSATGYVPLRVFRALPRHVLQACRSPLGDAFLAGALQRGWPGLLVSLVRLPGIEFNANDRAALFQAAHPYVCEAIEIIARRARWLVTGLKWPTLLGPNCKAKSIYGRRKPRTERVAECWPTIRHGVKEGGAEGNDGRTLSPARLGEMGRVHLSEFLAGSRTHCEAHH